MADKRNRIIDLCEYLESLGIQINIAKNKARGHLGFFKAQGQTYRIDVKKGLEDDAVLKTLAHEFAHFIHFQVDKKLLSLDSILGDVSDELLENILDITVRAIPKDLVKPLFDIKSKLEIEIKQINYDLQEILKISSNFKSINDIEKYISKSHYSYLLNHDIVKIQCGITCKHYSIKSLVAEEEVLLYLNLRSKERALKRVKSRMSRLNRYYNSPSELWARTFEAFITDRDYFEAHYPKLFEKLENVRVLNKIPYLSTFIEKTL